MSGFEVNGAGFVGLEGLLPAGDADAPSVAGLKAGKGPLGTGSHQVIADLVLVFKELGGNLTADEVEALVFRAGATAAVAVKAGQRGIGAEDEVRAENVLGHGRTVGRGKGQELP